MTALEVIERRGGPNCSNFHIARQLYQSYRAADKHELPEYVLNSFALAAVYEAGKIDGIREERDRRRTRGKGKKAHD